MAAERKLTVVLAGDATKLNSTLSTSGTKVDTFGSKVSGLSGRAKVAFAGLAAGAATFATSSVKAYVESEEAQNRLSDAFAKFPALAGANIGAIRDLNEQLALKTRFDDDATASGQAVLAQFGLNQSQLETLTPLMQDYAAKTGKDLPTAAQDLGKAMLGQGRSLKAVGIDFKDAGSLGANLDQVVGGLRTQVGGFAEKEGQTAAGKAEILKNQFGELQETVGSKLVPILTTLADAGLKVIAFMSNLDPKIGIAIAAVAGLAAAVWLIITAQKVWTAAQLAFNIVMGLNPVVLIVAGIVAFIAIVVIAYQKVGWFRDLVDGAFRVIKTAIMGAFNWVKNNWPLLLAILTGPIGLAVLAITKNWDTIKSGIKAAKDFVVGTVAAIVGHITGMPGRIARAASGMWDGIKGAFRSALNWIIRKWNSLQFTLPSFSAFGVSIGGQTIGTPNIPELHSGGVFQSGQGQGLAMLKDGEGVFTPRQMAAMGGTVNVYVAGSVLSERDLIATINGARRKGIA